MRHVLSVSSVLVIVLFHTPVWAVIIESATGPTAASITAARDAFRSDLGGGTVAGANGSFGGVRREINWDGVPDALSAPNNLPADFFNVNSPRGAIFTTSGSGFQVSANAGVAPINFGSIDASYATTFASFSPQRLFTSLGSNVLDVLFFVPGTNIPATVHGFGAVFSDVDLADTTSIQFFAANNTSLGTFSVPATVGTQTFSFLGVLFDSGEGIARIRITNGNSALGAGITETATRDLVVDDDFLYSEPRAVPEPSSLVLLTGGVLTTFAIRASRKRWAQRFRRQ